MKTDTSCLAANVLSKNCPSRMQLMHLTNRWGVLVMFCLRRGTHRFSELRRRIDGISEKMLTQTLRDLENDGFLFIEVPDFTFLDKKNDTLLFEHVNYFSHATLTQALDRAGYIFISHKFSITDNYTTCSDRVLRVLARKKSERLFESIPKALERHENFRVKKINDIINDHIKQVGNKGKIGFYGAGWWTERTIQKISIDKKMILGIFDKDEKKQKTTFHGFPILNPSEIIKLKPDIIFILTSFEPQIKNDLEKIGFDGEVIGWSDLVKQSNE